MSNYKKELNELFQCHNLISHIGKRLNLEQGKVTEASAVVIHSRSVYTLRNKLTELTRGNPSLTANFQLGLGGLQKLVHFTATVCSKFTEDSESILSSKQHETLLSYYETVRDGVLFCAGYLAFLLESKTDEHSVKDFYEDKLQFIELAKETYVLISEQEELNTVQDLDGDNIRPIMSTKDAKESKLSKLADEQEVILGTSSKIDTDPLK